MGAGIGTLCESNCHAPSDDTLALLGRHSQGITRKACDDAPKLLRVKVPRGPVRVSGYYRLVPGQTPNGHPLWKATNRNMYLYSMENGRWAIGGRREFEGSFRDGAAFVYCDVPHGGQMPDAFGRQWMHNRPAWTLDVGITVESWPETVVVVLQKEKTDDKYGMQTALVEPANTQPSGPAALRVHAIGVGSLLDNWNLRAAAKGWRTQIVAAGCDIVRVGALTDAAKMQQALLTESKVEVEFRWPEGSGSSRRSRRGSAGEGFPADDCLEEPAQVVSNDNAGEGVAKVVPKGTPAHQPPSCDVGTEEPATPTGRGGLSIGAAVPRLASVGSGGARAAVAAR